MTVEDLQQMYPQAHISSTRRAASFQLEIEALVEPDLLTGVPTQEAIEQAVTDLADKIMAFRTGATPDANQAGE